MPDYLRWVALLGAAWLLQLILSFEQMRRFRRRLGELRTLGRAAVGVGGGKYRGRAYAVVVSDPQQRVVRAEIMSGISVFARLKEVPQVRGCAVSALSAAPPAQLAGKKQAALRAAAAALEKSRESATDLRQQSAEAAGQQVQRTGA